MEYPLRHFLPELEVLNNKLNETIGFVPNNCLINFYPDGKSKMGFHADQTDILESDTGIAIVSLVETRTLMFRKIDEPCGYVEWKLPLTIKCRGRMGGGGNRLYIDLLIG